jgi:hypothetical protein
MPISLRDVEAADVDRLFQWRNEPEVDRWMYSVPPTIQQHRAWFAAFMEDDDRKGWIILRDGEACGSLTLEGLVGAQRRAKWGWYIGDAEARGRGAGRAAQALGLDRAFEDFGLQKVWSEVLADNETALRGPSLGGVSPRRLPAPPRLQTRQVPRCGDDVDSEGRVGGAANGCRAGADDVGADRALKR